MGLSSNEYSRVVDVSRDSMDFAWTVVRLTLMFVRSAIALERPNNRTPMFSLHLFTG